MATDIVPDATIQLLDIVVDLFSEILVNIYSGIVTTRYVSVAALTWLVWDTLITFEQERQWIWGSDGSLVKNLFLTNKYSAIVIILADLIQFSGSVTLSDNICFIWFIFNANWQTLAVLAIQFLSGLRMCVICGNKRWTKIFVYGGSILCALITITSITFVLAGMETEHKFAWEPTLKICYNGGSTPKWLWVAFFVPVLLFDVLLFSITLWNVSSTWTHIPKDSVAFVLCRDGFIYFFLILGTEIASILVAAIIDFSKLYMFKSLFWAIQNVLITHMTFNLVDVVRKPDMELSTMEYSTTPAAFRPTRRSSSSTQYNTTGHDSISECGTLFWTPVSRPRPFSTSASVGH